MKKILVHILRILVPAMLALSCNGRELQHSFSEDETPRLTINGKEILSFDPLLCQCSFSETERRFMVFTDTMSDYYILTLDKIPSKPDTEVRGSLVWTTEFNIEKKNDVRFRVERVDEDGWLWLWNNSSKIGVAVRLL